MGSEKDRIRVLMFPTLAHGHITPFLELAKRLSRRNFHIHLCSTTANHSSIENKISKNDSLNIQLIELHLPSLPELPPDYHTSNGLPLHLKHIQAEVFELGKPSFFEILQRLQLDLLIHDIHLPWAGKMASRLNIPAVFFYTSSPATFSRFCHLFTRPGEEFPFEALRLTDFELAMATKNTKSGGSHEIGPESPDDEIPNRSDTIMLVNSCRVIGGKYMDYLTEMIRWSVLLVGALVQEPNLGDDDDNDNDNDNDDTELMEWLGKKELLSTVFVAFGSEHLLEKEEIDEIAYAMELSNVNFVWVIRFAKGDETRAEEVLPEGFLERVGERGKIMEKWAPQAKILRHSSVGGFVSHCGWNSILESIDNGVPIIGMPMQLDQPINAKLVVEMGFGLEVKRDDEGKYRKEEISRVIKDVIYEESGINLRSKIGEQSEIIRSRSSEELDEVVQKLREICGKNQQA